jgi:hypothetical protein
LACRGDEPISALPLPDVGVFAAAMGAVVDDDDDDDDIAEAVLAVVSPAQFGQNHGDSRAARTRPSMPAHLW